MAFGKWNTSGELTWASGDALTAADLNDSIDEAMLPIGSIVAWNKSFTGVPGTLPTGWVECDGSTISDADSPLNGQTLPDLNGDGRFLKGASTSNTENAAGTHVHQWGKDASGSYTIQVRNVGGAGYTDASYNSVGAQTNLTNSGTDLTNDWYTSSVAGGDPVNYTVVWIIRKK